MSSNQPPADEQLLETDNFAAELFWQRHRGSIILAAAVLLAILGGTALWFINAHNSRLESEAAFAQARNPEAWREVIAKYPDSLPAANAYFLLAESLREQGSLAESTQTYLKFLQVFPTHPLAGGARLGLAENEVMAGKTTEAVTALREVQTLNSGSYAAPYAALLEGRIALRQGRLEEARKIFLQLVSTHSQSPAARVAGAQLEEIVPLLPAETTPNKTVQ